MDTTRQYELTVLFAPDLTPDILKKKQDMITSFVKDKGGSVELDVWGKKKLAYKIRKFDEAVYVLFQLSLSPSFVKELDTMVLHEDGVLRHLIVTALDN